MAGHETESRNKQTAYAAFEAWRKETAGRKELETGLKEAQARRSEAEEALAKLQSDLKLAQAEKQELAASTAAWASRSLASEHPAAP